MPQLIRTPEEIFRKEGKAIYMIRFADGESESAARDEVLQWLKTHLPGTHYEKLAPSEHSGFICGYFGTLRVDFSQADLATFCERWEHADGKSVDPRFQCYCMPYQAWHDGVAKFVPTLDRPTSPGISCWWDTPLGVAYHQISLPEAQEQELHRHPCLHRDIWFNIVNSFPALADVAPDTLTHGQNALDRDGTCFMIYTEPVRHQFTDQRKAELLEWFNLPADTQVIENDW